MFDESWTTDSHGWVRSKKMTDLLVDGKCKTERTEGACLGCVQCSRLFCSLCKHDHTSQFSLSQGGSAAYKKQCVLDHCKKKHPVRTETRNLAAMFVDGMRNENDKWWDGTLLARLPKAHAKYPLYYSVRNTDGEVAYTPLVHEDYGVDREWVIIQKRRR
jgi:hypothetical protein